MKLITRLLALTALSLMVVPNASGTKTAWGAFTLGNDRVVLHVRSVPENGNLSLPRLNNPIGKVYIENTEKEPKRFWPERDEWVITLGKDLPAVPFNVIVEIKDGPARLAGKPVMAMADKEGKIALPAHYAKAHGTMLRYEPQSHKNTIGYWVNEKDWVEWSFIVAEAGTYEVRIWQGCGTGQGGSEVDILIGDQKLEFTVEDTGHFQNFKERSLGKVALKAGANQSLEIRPQTKAANAIMDVRLIELVPVRP